MAKNDVYRIDYADMMYFVGTAQDLSDLCKSWITEDIYRIPCENQRSFYTDEEFISTLQVADTLDDLWLNTCNSHSLYIMSYDTQTYEYKVEKIECKMLEEIL